MKKFFKSKGFIVSALIVLCVAILGVCWFVSRDRTEDFKPEDSPPSSTTSGWTDGGSQSGDESNGADSYASGQNSGKEEEYPKVTSETEDEVVIDFTDTEKPKETPPPEPESRPTVEGSVDTPPADNDPSVPKVTAPPEEKPADNGPAPGSSNGNGAVYDPVFGWIVPGQGEQTIGDSDGDLNKQVGNMG